MAEFKPLPPACVKCEQVTGKSTCFPSPCVFFHERGTPGTTAHNVAMLDRIRRGMRGLRAVRDLGAEAMTGAPTMPDDALVANLRSSAKAFRENTVYNSEGDPLRLTVQADECDQAAARLTALSAEVARRDRAIEALFRTQWMIEEIALGAGNFKDVHECVIANRSVIATLKGPPNG